MSVELSDYEKSYSIGSGNPIYPDTVSQSGKSVTFGEDSPVLPGGKLIGCTETTRSGWDSSVKGEQVKYYVEAKDGERREATLAERLLFQYLTDECVIDNRAETVVPIGAVIPVSARRAYDERYEDDIKLAYIAANRTAFYYEADEHIQKIANILNTRQATAEALFNLIENLDGTEPPNEGVSVTSASWDGKNLSVSIKVQLDRTLPPATFQLEATAAPQAVLALNGRTITAGSPEAFVIANTIMRGGQLDGSNAVTLAQSYAIASEMPFAERWHLAKSMFAGQDQEEMPVILKAAAEKHNSNCPVVVYVGKSSDPTRIFYMETVTETRRMGRPTSNVIWCELVYNGTKSPLAPAVVSMPTNDPRLVTALNSAAGSHFPVIISEDA